jgi:hypothetical protein
MKRTTLQMNKPSWLGYCQPVVRPLLALALTLSVFLGQPVSDSTAFADELPCVYPKDVANPLCGFAINECVKFVHNPTPSNCDGPPCQWSCIKDTVAGTWTVYTHPGTSDADCGCDSNGWELSSTHSGDVNQATQNDQECTHH